MKKGFTLVELLVVIAIFVMVLSVGMYWLSSARYSAKRLVSIRNLEAIGQMLGEYASDHRGAYPRPANDGLATPDNNYGAKVFTSFSPDTSPYLGDKIFPAYCSDPLLFFCPLSNYAFVAALWFKKADNTFNIPRGSYWSYTYLAHRGAGHSDEDVVAGRVLAESCSLYGKYISTGSTIFDRETLVLYSDFSVKIESRFKW